MVEIVLEPDDVESARDLASRRLHEPRRRLSPDRPTARNPAAQLRGSIGEIAAARWLVSEGLDVRRGFDDDARDISDLVVAGVPVEVMTAQVAHRERTGFCVPPNKLWAARQRRAWGYIFVGTGAEDVPTAVLIQGGCAIEDVDLDPVKATYVNSPRYSVDNFVVREAALLTPDRVIACIRAAAR